MARRPVTHALDPLTRRWWRAVGRPVDLSTPDFAFLAAPHNGRLEVGDAWLHRYEKRGEVDPPSPNAGLFDDMSVLDGPDFRAADLHPMVRDFYEHTGSWRMEVWSQWNPLFAPGGMAVAALFGRRVEQLALPTEPLSVSRGMSSEVRVVTGDSGGTGRVRPGSGACASTALLCTAGSIAGRSCRGSHSRTSRSPFRSNSATSMCSSPPHARRPTGALTLTSRSRRFGEDGAYVSVLFGEEWHSAQPPLRESFRVYVDDEGVLRTDHELRVGRFRALRLHYRLERH